jgi:two-component system cell cycle sensor histidine kinase/response regulator CckA
MTSRFKKIQKPGMDIVVLQRSARCVLWGFFAFIFSYASPLFDNHVKDSTSALDDLLALQQSLLKTQPDSVLALGSQIAKLCASGCSQTNEAQWRTNSATAFYYKQQFDSSLHYYRIALPLWRQLDDPEGQARVSGHMALMLWHLGELREALSLSEESILLKRSIGDSLDLAKALNNHGLILRKLGRYDASLLFLQEALLIKETIAVPAASICNAYTNIGVLYWRLKNYPMAQANFDKAIAIAKAANYQKGLANGNNNLGLMANEQEKYAEALQYFEASLTIARQMQNERKMSIALNNKGNAHMKLEQFSEARNSFASALQLARKNGRQIGIISILTGLGELAHREGKNREAIRYMSEARELAEKTGAMDRLDEIYKPLLMLYRSVSEEKKALQLADTYLAFKDTVFHKEKAGRLAELQAQRIAIENIREHQRLRENELKQQRFLLIILVLLTLALLVIVIFVILYRYNRKARYFYSGIFGSLRFPFRVYEPKQNTIQLANFGSEQSSAIEFDNLPADLLSEVYPEIEQKFASLTETVLQHRRIISQQFRFHFADHHRRFFLLVCYPVFGKSDEIRYVVQYLRDVTDQVETEAALRDSRERYHTLVEHSPNPIVVYVDHKIYYVNDAAVKLVGAKSPAEIIGRHVTTFIHPDSKPLSDGRARKLMDGSQLDPAEQKITTIDGRAITIYSNSVRVNYDGFDAVLSQMTDITELKAYEEALNASESRYRTLIEYSPYPIAVYIDLKMYYVNKAAVKLMGAASPEDLIGLPVEGFIHKDSTRVFNKRVDTVLSGRFLEPVREKINTLDGRVIVVYANTVPIQYDGQDAVLAQFTDLTRLEEYERALIASEERHRALIEELPFALVVHRHGIIKYANPAAARMVGVESPKALIGVDVLNFVHGDQKEEAIQRIRDLWQHKIEESVPSELKLIHQNGDIIDVKLMAKRVEYEKQTAVQELIEDVTERKQLERQLLQSQKMEAVGQLAGGIAHDFNNILTIIKGYSDLMALNDAIDERSREQIGYIAEAAERAASLTRQLLAFSRKQILRPQVIDLNDLVNVMKKMLQRLIGENISLYTNLHSAPVFVKADPGQMEQVVMNIVINSRDAMPEGGVLTLETGLRSITDNTIIIDEETVKGNFAFLRIADNGIGMDAETLKRIFEPFYTTKDVGKGTGLGLSTVYGIIKQSGGFILTESEKDKGTENSILLPNSEESKAHPENAEKERVLRGTETILIVEDEEVIAGLIYKTLQRYGYKTLVATDASIAVNLSAMHEGNIDLLVVDVVMPNLSGKELAQKILPENPGMSVLFMSGYTRDTISQHGILEEDTHFIQKPFAMPDLVEQIRRVLGQQEKQP